MSSSKGKKIRVGVLFGGRSGEHEVSLTSAKGIMNAMDKDKYEVVPIGITKSGQWLAGGDIHRRLVDVATGQPALQDSLTRTEPAADKSLTLPISETGPLDVVFPVLHGPFGEDGTVQGFLELAGVPYVGAGVTASAAGMDKDISKRIFQAHRLPVLPYLTFLRGRWQNDPDSVIDQCQEQLAYPMFVKPANLGSSVGVHKAKNQAELRAAIEDAARYDRKLVVEQGVEAREIEVSVLGNDEPVVSVPGEIIPSREFYSYAAKYIDDSSDLIIPAPLMPEQTTQIQQLAVAAFQSLDCAGLARCDFLLDRTSGKIYLNELNTMPGFTPISMYPKLWEASGLPYSKLIDRLIALAIERFEDKQQSETDFNVSSAE